MLTYSETFLFRVGISVQKVNKSTRKRCELCPELTKQDTRMTSIDIDTQLIDVTLVSFFKSFSSDFNFASKDG